ncbi:MAG: MBOAT family protein [Parasporobacterium sp.]|nr:MBOAT family protein [Parasporobacterium sp.]
MLFTSFEFIGFVIVLFLLYYTVFKRHQWVLLLIASIVFYALANPFYLIFIFASIFTIWFFAKRIQIITDGQKQAFENKELSKLEKKEIRTSNKRKKVKWLVLGIVINFGILIAVKYTNFFITNINGVLSAFGKEGTIGFVDIIMPLGISFYTLQVVGYLIDVYRGTTSAEKNPLKLALFVSFFPQVIQGPISKFSDLSKTLYSNHSFDSTIFFHGLQRIMWGFFKKLVIADRIMPAVLTITGDVDTYGGAYAFFGMLFYTLQLYADFTGGIDITIGVAQALGVDIKENFMRPFFSKTLKEYWRRWHITMCEWFRNYLFYPISTSNPLLSLTQKCRKAFGERVGRRIPVYISSFVVWFATGIWHGANWNFILWGLLNWAILMVGEEIEPMAERFHARFGLKNKAPFIAFQIIRTFLIVNILNLFDCFAMVGETLKAIASMFTVHNWRVIGEGALLNLGITASDYIIIIIGIAIMLVVSIFAEKTSVLNALSHKPFYARAILWGALFIAIVVFGAYGIGYDASQFIYNRF